MPKKPCQVRLGQHGVARVQLPERPPALTTSERGYGAPWQRLRRAWLNAEPRFCRLCLDEGYYVPAEEVDHIIPHRRDPVKLYDWNNLQGLCRKHHIEKTIRENRCRGEARDSG